MWWQLIICFVILLWLIEILELEAGSLPEDWGSWHLDEAEEKVNIICQIIKSRRVNKSLYIQRAGRFKRDVTNEFKFVPIVPVDVDHFKEIYMNQWKGCHKSEAVYTDIDLAKKVYDDPGVIEFTDKDSYEKLKEIYKNNFTGPMNKIKIIGTEPTKRWPRE